MNIVIEDYITVWKCQEDYVFNFIDSFQIKNEEIDDYGKYKKVYYEIDYKTYEHFLYNSFSINYNNKILKCDFGFYLLTKNEQDKIKKHLK